MATADGLRPKSPNDARSVTASVIVPTHRGSHRLPLLLRALEAQSFTGTWELLVVVDGVLDDTLEILARYEARLPMRVVVQPDPVGVCRGLNAGYAAARGRVLIRCDDDLTPAPDMIERHVRWHEAPGLRGVVGPTRDVFPDTPYARAYGRTANERALAAARVRPAPDRWVHWAAHNSVTREAWELGGGFDDRFVFGQDSELGWRLQKAGVEIVIDPALEIPHRGPATRAETRVPRAYVAGASRRIFVRVHSVSPHPAAGSSTLLGRAWGTGTAFLAWACRTREGYRTIGAVLDRAIAVLPGRLGSRLVAFAIEAAALSGERHGPDDLQELRTQKSRELAVELPGN